MNKFLKPNWDYLKGISFATGLNFLFDKLLVQEILWQSAGVDGFPILQFAAMQNSGTTIRFK